MKISGATVDGNDPKLLGVADCNIAWLCVRCKERRGAFMRRLGKEFGSRIRHGWHAWVRWNSVHTCTCMAEARAITCFHVNLILH